MIIGMSLQAFTALHVVISLVAIASGGVVAFEMLHNRLSAGWNGFFLVTTALTSITGFMYPFHGMTPGIMLGIISMVLLVVAAVACYGRHLERGWRRSYAILAVTLLYLNVFVLVAQSFQKVPQLKALAPTQSAPPFLAAQSVVFVLFVVLGVLAARRFHNPARRQAAFAS
jgi:hypothetical protein